MEKSKSRYPIDSMASIIVKIPFDVRSFCDRKTRKLSESLGNFIRKSHRKYYNSSRSDRVRRKKLSCTSWNRREIDEPQPVSEFQLAGER